jgi:hypothetical protein
MKFLLRDSLAKWRSSVVMFVGFLAFTLIIVSAQAAEATTATVTTNHWKSGAGEGYSLTFTVPNPLHNLSQVTLTSGPGVSSSVNLIINENGDIFSTSIPVVNRPAINDTYAITVVYSDGTPTEVLAPKVTAVLDSFATPTAPLGGIASTASPTFTWTPPATPPTGFSGYMLSITGAELQWNSAILATNVTSSSTSANPATGALYDWSIAVLDANGNSAETRANFMIGTNIQGTVTNATGQVIPGVIVSVYSANIIKASAVTQADGTYLAGGLAAGNYKVSFEYPNFPTIYYNNKIDVAQADLVQVISGTIKSNINAVIGQWGALTGKVTNSSGTGVAGVKVSACDINGNIIAAIPEAVTAADGSYTVNMIPAGSYKIKFRASSLGYVDLWFRYDKSSGSLANANTVSVTAGATTSLTTAVLYLPQISGKVTNMSGQALTGVSVQLLDSTTFNSIPNFTSVQTLADGSYVIGGIPAGNYIVYFNDKTLIYAKQYYNLKASPELANPVAFSTTVKTNINGVLGTILPTITAFSVPAASTTLVVSGISITATQLNGITGYLLTENTAVPSSSAAGWSATAPTTYTFASGGTKTLYAWAKDATGTVSAPASATTTITLPTFALTLTFAGTGSGSVNGDMSCIKGQSCAPLSFPANSTVTLTPTADSNSLFGGWSSACTTNIINNNCTVTMTSAKTVTATFTTVPPAKMNGTYYPTLQAAYDVAPNGAVILMKDGVFAGTLTAGRNISVTIKGGYNSSYNPINSETTIKGPILLRAGTVRMEKINTMK